MNNYIDLENTTLDNNIGSKWQAWSGSCPKCKSLDTEFDSSFILTSLPPKNRCRCKSCEHTWYESYNFPSYNENLPYPSGKLGWICPKCGRSISPYSDSCPYCSNYNTFLYCTTSDVRDVTYNMETSNIISNDSKTLNRAVNKNELC